MAILTPEHVILPEVALTTNMEITNGVHILYVSANLEKYIDNAVVFIESGLSLGQGVVFIDDKVTVDAIKARLTLKGMKEEQLDSVVFGDRTEFYESNDILNPTNVIHTFSTLIKPLLEKGKPLRTWGKVEWLNGQSCLVDKLKKYETACDKFVNDLNAFTVCAYDGMELPASIHMELMKTHQYIMSDTEFSTSSFYDHERLAPSIRMEANYKDAISKLQKIHTHYTKFIDEMPDPVFIISKDVIVYANKSAIKIVECDPKELLGKLIWDLTPPSFHEIMKRRQKKRLNGEQTVPLEQKFVTSTGNVIDVEISSFPFAFEGMDDVYISIVRDIKERKEHQKLAIKNEKLGITGQLAASIAHEIRNPLTSIKGFMKLAQEGTLNIDIYSIIDQEIERIETIASELLILGKPVSMKMKKLNVKNLLQNVCTLMQSQANMDSVIIHFKTVEKRLYIECNEVQMKQVFINIIKNAIEATQSGGTISIDAKDHQGDVVINIMDEGQGIPDHIKNRLGEPFYSTKEKGTGLGLMVCYNIIEQHNGQIVFTSRVGTGTTFTIRLPLKSNSHDSEPLFS